MKKQTNTEYTRMQYLMPVICISLRKISCDMALSAAKIKDLQVLQCICITSSVFDKFIMQCNKCARFFTRDSIYAIAHICYGNSVCPTVCPSVTRVDQSKTVEARITQFSPYSSPIPLVFRG